MNVLFITLDQFRGDCLSGAGHPVVRTPNLDALACQGIYLSRHYSQAAPCGPGRACLYTGTYTLTNRVVANGTPLDDRFDNVARAARRAGYTPTLFGYTDQGIDPRQADGPTDRRLWTFEGVLPGFAVELELLEDQQAWRAWLAQLGYDLPSDGEQVLAGEPGRPEEHSVSTFLTDRLIAWIERQDAPWFAHASYFRPHPPFAAAGRWARAYDPSEVPLPIAPAEKRHPFLDAVLQHPLLAAPQDERAVRELIAQYYGMVSEVDHQLGRVWEALRRIGQWDDTFVIVPSDHGEQLGDHHLLGKLGYFDESFRIPLIVRDPSRSADATRGRVVEAFTETIDVMPTILEWVGVPVPRPCDGVSLRPFLSGETPAGWRREVHYEFDFRTYFTEVRERALDLHVDQCSLAVIQDARYKYVHFDALPALFFDLEADPGQFENVAADPAYAGRVLEYAQKMLSWRLHHADRTLTGWSASPQGLVDRSAA